MHVLDPGRRRTRSGTLALALGACLCAGQLIAATPASAEETATATTTATVASAAVTPRVTVAANRYTIGWGQLALVHARFLNPATGGAVTGPAALQVWDRTRWRTIRFGQLSRYGSLGIWLRPGASHTYRALYGGQVRDGVRMLNPVVSRNIPVMVRPSGAQIVSVARSLSGRPYRWGAAGPRAFDCSGFTQYVVRKVLGRTLPHRANAQQRYGRWIAKSRMRPGDLIFFRSGTHAYHTGIYAGGGYMYDAPRPGRTVGKHKIWSRNYVVRRLV